MRKISRSTQMTFDIQLLELHEFSKYCVRVSVVVGGRFARWWLDNGSIPPTSSCPVILARHHLQALPYILNLLQLIKELRVSEVNVMKEKGSRNNPSPLSFSSSYHLDENASLATDYGSLNSSKASATSSSTLMQEHPIPGTYQTADSLYKRNRKRRGSLPWMDHPEDKRDPAAPTETTTCPSRLYYDQLSVSAVSFFSFRKFLANHVNEIVYFTIFAVLLITNRDARNLLDQAAGVGGIGLGIYSMLREHPKIRRLVDFLQVMLAKPVAFLRASMEM